MFPDFHQQQNEEIFAQRQLYKTRLEIRETLQQSHAVMEISSALLLNHFKDVPKEKLSSYISCFFDSYDINKNGLLEISEVQKALQDLGKPCSVEDVREFFVKAGAPGDAIDHKLFENVVRTMQGWEAPVTALPKAQAVTVPKARAESPMAAASPLFKPPDSEVAAAGGV